MFLLHPSNGRRGNFCRRTDPSKKNVLRRKYMCSVNGLQEGQTQTQMAETFLRLLHLFVPTYFRDMESCC